MTMAREKIVGVPQNRHRKGHVPREIKRERPPNVTRKVNQRVRACVILTLTR
jgi:hypothetical protein